LPPPDDGSTAADDEDDEKTTTEKAFASVRVLPTVRMHIYRLSEVAGSSRAAKVLAAFSVGMILWCLKFYSGPFFEKPCWGPLCLPARCGVNPVVFDHGPTIFRCTLSKGPIDNRSERRAEKGINRNSFKELSKCFKLIFCTQSMSAPFESRQFF
jgi:hypothetical protein